MVKVIWSDRAIFNLNEIFHFIRSDDPAAADQTAANLMAAAHSLEIFPNRGRPVRAKIRELVTVRPYIIRYRLEDDAIRILFVRHAAQRRDT
ncbi:type II toxin-antitoxin system RelE/ParE family toxin [Sphingomonas sp. BIUV-7]|uniref:Type II toxin-antitoxin system RelE/ParE family toxin n=1 Tax=Sphingomonas natans TaxID=3063330 RepID=A0ABT8YDA5_9SPHN|nr:type II toxin-antitoxin system RelE/ParE family toxin [Sphingomonas sp. BIUV-7]MDO6416328.1 type II toxin-antitoxin system RelE/ParE family toxin [Sphingomonas sp. BIUV-7]